MFKTLGIVIIITLTTYLGFYFAMRLRDRTKQIMELQMCLQMLETEISFASTPLEIAFQKISQSQKGPIGSLFHQCSYYFQHLDGASTEECWQMALNDIKPRLALKQIELDWLSYFGQIVGNSDRKDQQKHIQLVMAQWRKQEAESREEQQKYEKMYKTLGVLTGLLIVILIW